MNRPGQLELMREASPQERQTGARRPAGSTCRRPRAGCTARRRRPGGRGSAPPAPPTARPPRAASPAAACRWCSPAPPPAHPHAERLADSTRSLTVRHPHRAAFPAAACRWCLPAPTPALSRRAPPTHPSWCGAPRCIGAQSDCQTPTANAGLQHSILEACWVLDTTISVARKALLYRKAPPGAVRCDAVKTRRREAAPARSGARAGTAACAARPAAQSLQRRPAGPDPPARGWRMSRLRHSSVPSRRQHCAVLQSECLMMR